MFSKIILAATPRMNNQYTADIAFALARRHNAEVIIYHACGLPEGDWGGAEKLISCDKLVSSAAKNIEEHFKSKLEGVNYKLHIVCRTPASDLAALATAEKADLLVMGPHCCNSSFPGNKMWGMVDTNIGTVSMQTVTPVLVVTGPSSLLKRDPETIALATDMSTPSESALCYATRLAQAFGAKLKLFHVLDTGLAYPNPKFYQQDMEVFIDEAKAKMERKYAHILKDTDHEYESWEGVPYCEIRKFARWSKADILVMARHSSMKDSHQALIGSTVVQVSLSPGCPALIVNYRAKSCR